MKNKLLFSAAALAVAFGVSDLSARSLNTFDESDRVAIGAYNDRVNAVVESLGLSASATTKSTPLKAVEGVALDPAFLGSAFGEKAVAEFVVKELSLTGVTSEAALSTALIAKLSDKTFNVSDFVRKLADMMATTAVKVEPLRTALDAKVTALATAKAVAKTVEKPVVVVTVPAKTDDKPAVVVPVPAKTDGKPVPAKKDGEPAVVVAPAVAVEPAVKPLTAEEVDAIPAAKLEDAAATIAAVAEVVGATVEDLTATAGVGTSYDALTGAAKDADDAEALRIILGDKDK